MLVLDLSAVTMANGTPDALDTVREIGRFIKYSSKRSYLFNQKLVETDSDSVATIKSLCITRWTARTIDIEAVLEDYPILMEITSLCPPGGN